MANDVNTARSLIAQDKIEEAIALLTELDKGAKAGLETDLIIQSARYTRITGDYLRGGIFMKDRDSVLAQIREALLALADKLPAPLPTTTISEKVLTRTPTPPPATANGPVRFVLLYDVADKDAADRIHRQLFVAQKTNKITLFRVHEASSAADLMESARQACLEADYVLCLISNNLTSGEAPWFSLMLEMYEAKKIIIPIRLQVMDLTGTGIERVRGIPSLNRTVMDFPNLDAAFADIATEIGKLFKK